LTFFALVLVLAAATFHATWNLLAKRVGDGGAVFVWLFGFLAMLIYAPLAVVVVLLERPHFGPEALVFMFGSGVLHLGYFVLLQRGYAVGDLSLVYPLARGAGPLLSTAVAIPLFDERPTPLALGGAGLIVVAILSLTGRPADPGDHRARTAALYAALTGALIAAYTLWDKHAVDDLELPPVVYNWGQLASMALVIGAAARPRREQLRATWTAYRRQILGVGVLSPIAYVLVLYALTMAPVSYVAPAREVSIVIGAALGARLLGEGDARKRMASAAAIVAGVAALALG
jgi:drug/metabolite transporter (DMT)-like permease